MELLLEKQKMLFPLTNSLLVKSRCSVFCVTTLLAKDTPIFIDEPELSLHIDWQRRLLVPTLLDQRHW